MKKESVIYRDVLTAYKAIAATYNADGSPNQAVWRSAKRIIRRAYDELDTDLAEKLQLRAIDKSSPAAEPMDFADFDWDSPANWTKSE